MKPGAIVIEGHVQGLSNTRSLGEAGVPVYVVDTGNCIAKYSKYCTKFFKCPDYHSDEFALFLMELAEKEHIKDWLLIPSNDHAVHTISRHKTRLEKKFKVITPSIEIIDQIYDKSRLFEVARSVNVPIPETYDLTQLQNIDHAAISFPVLTKGRNGLTFYKTTGQKAFLAENKEQLKEQLKTIKEELALTETFTQELIPYDGINKTISFTAFCVDGEIKTHWTGVKLREHPLRFGTATFAKSIYVQECYDQSKELLKTLNYTGVCEVEYLKDPRDGLYKLIEINARTWLWVELAKACGVDYAKLIYDYVNGIPIEYPEVYEVGRYWWNPVTDLVYGMMGMLRKHYGIKEYFDSLRSLKENTLHRKGDMKPCLAYIYHLFNFFKNR